MDASYLFARNFFNVKYEDLPAKVVEETKKQVLDFIGVAIAGFNKDGAKEVRELAIELGGAPQSSIIGTKVKVPAPNAAQANASVAHSLDFDDVHEAAIMHPGVITIPTSLAMAEYKGGLSGKEFIKTVAVGGDMISRMGLATRPGENIHKYGWHFTTLNGYMTSAAVASSILGLSEEQMIYAIGIAYHQSAGNGQAVKDSALTKRLGPGFSVRGGIHAALLAQKGVTGAKNSMEGVNGYYKVYHMGSYSRDILIGELGTRFESANITIKPYPCCRGVHPFIDAALYLVKEYKFEPEDVKSIMIWCGKGTQGLLGEPLEIKAKPRVVVDAQFSLAWGVATALAKKQVGLQHYTDEAIKDPAILDMAAKISLAYDPALDSTGLEPGRVAVTLKDGKTYSVQMDTATGSPERPITFEECENKFRNCIEFADRSLPPENVEKVINMVKDLENLSDIRELINLLVW
ncbi:MAG: MmgE/PrpD family protein [Peptococcaceae bacterium]|nr:MmgE/PrpD family protein [Peptococcaceae bacterium]